MCDYKKEKINGKKKCKKRSDKSYKIYIVFNFSGHNRDISFCTFKCFYTMELLDKILIASVVWNFTLNREITFKATNNIAVAMIKVVCFYLVFTPISTIFGNYLAESLKWNELLVTALNMICNFVLEYLYDKFFVFRGSIDSKELKNK